MEFNISCQSVVFGQSDVSMGHIEPDQHEIFGANTNTNIREQENSHI